MNAPQIYIVYIYMPHNNVFIGPIALSYIDTPYIITRGSIIVNAPQIYIIYIYMPHNNVFLLDPITLVLY